MKTYSGDVVNPKEDLVYLAHLLVCMYILHASSKLEKQTRGFSWSLKKLKVGTNSKQDLPS